MKSMVDSKTWKEKENKCIQYLRDNCPDIQLTSKAYLAIGVKK
jgi:hypothetical protein